MGRRHRRARVNGPYRETDRRGNVYYRVVQIDHEGERCSHTAKTKREANLLVKACLIALGIPDDRVLTVTGAIEQFEAHKRSMDAWSERTFARTGRDLRFFAAKSPEAPIETVGVGASWAVSMLERMREAGHAPAYQQSRYNAVAEFLGWCVRRGYIRSNPCDLIHKGDRPWCGKRAKRQMGRGKPQLRNMGECIAYLAAAESLAKPADRVAAQLPLRLGMRSGEVRHLQVGDVDFTDGKLWVRDLEAQEEEMEGWSVKTATSRRSLDLPAALEADLRQLVAGKAETDLVFASNRNPGQAWDRKWLNRRVKRVCREAGVNVVCAHGLRDTYASFMHGEAGRSAPEIGRFLGHADGGKTAKRHYIGAPEHQPALRLVAGGKS